MKHLLSLMLVIIAIVSAFPGLALAAKQMNDDVPVWTEDTVRQYARDYIEGNSMDRLWGYYDLQIRRYMPMETYEALLIDLYWMTGDFIELGSYRSFEEPENKLKIHVLHLCMEKQDLDLYFTHKDKADDWEIMAIEFVPAAEESISDNSDMLVGEEDDSADHYSEIQVVVGKAPYELEGVLTMPVYASAFTQVPACVLVHDAGALDRDCTLGSTKLFKDMAESLAEMGIATIRYDKRTFAYPEAEIESVRDEYVEDALSAIEVLKQDTRIDRRRIVVIGLGVGAMLTPRIASEANGAVTGMVLIGSTPETLIEVDYQNNKESVAVLPSAEAATIQNAVRKIGGMSGEKARELTLFGRSGYYYWEAAQHNAIKLIQKLRIPVYVVQGRNDPVVSEEDGWKAYQDELGIYKALYTYEALRGLNHLLMNDLSFGQNGEPEYSIETHLDKYAAQSLGQWILNLILK